MCARRVPDEAESRTWRRAATGGDGYPGASRLAGTCADAVLETPGSPNRRCRPRLAVRIARPLEGREDGRVRWTRRNLFSRAEPPKGRCELATPGQLGWLAEIQTRFVPCLATDHKPRSLSPSRRFRGKKAAPTVQISNFKGPDQAHQASPPQQPPARAPQLLAPHPRQSGRSSPARFAPTRPLPPRGRIRETQSAAVALFD